MSADAERCAYTADPEGRFRCGKRARRDGLCKRHAAESRSDDAAWAYHRAREREAREAMRLEDDRLISIALYYAGAAR